MHTVRYPGRIRLEALLTSSNLIDCRADFVALGQFEGAWNHSQAASALLQYTKLLQSDTASHTFNLDL